MNALKFPHIFEKYSTLFYHEERSYTVYNLHTPSFGNDTEQSKSGRNKVGNPLMSPLINTSHFVFIH